MVAALLYGTLQSMRRKMNLLFCNLSFISVPLYSPKNILNISPNPPSIPKPLEIYPNAFSLHIHFVPVRSHSRQFGSLKEP